MQRIERDAAVHPGVQVAVAGPHREVEVADAAQADLDRRHVPAKHHPVEDDRRVRPTLVLLEPLHDRVAAGLLLPVTREAHVHRQLAGSRQRLARFEEHEQVRLVVGHAARVEPAVALGQLERRRLPELERVGRLHVEVRIDEDRRRRLWRARRAHLTDHEWAAVPVDDPGLAAGLADPVDHPLRGAPDVGAVRRIGADGRDRDQLREPCDERFMRPRHGPAV